MGRTFGCVKFPIAGTFEIEGASKYANGVEQVRHPIFIILLFAALSTSSCAVNVFPIPHMETQIPDIEGTLLDDGKPVVEHTVIFRYGRVDEGWLYTAQAITSAEGRFLIPGKSKFRPITILFGIPVNFGTSEYQLVLRHKDGRETVLQDYFTPNPPHTPKKIGLQCDLSRCSEEYCRIVPE